jgi:hypothetical protein
MKRVLTLRQILKRAVRIDMRTLLNAFDIPTQTVQTGVGVAPLPWTVGG